MNENPRVKLRDINKQNTGESFHGWEITPAIKQKVTK